MTELTSASSELHTLRAAIDQLNDAAIQADGAIFGAIQILRRLGEVEKP